MLRVYRATLFQMVMMGVTVASIALPTFALVFCEDLFQANSSHVPSSLYGPDPSPSLVSSMPTSGCSDLNLTLILWNKCRETFPCQLA